jgi:hypothetical protein
MPVLKYWDGAAWQPLAAPDITAAQSSYAYLGILNSGAMTAGSQNLFTMAAPTAPSSWLNNFTLQGGGQQLRCGQAGKYLAHMELTLNWTAQSSYAQVVINRYNSAGTLIVAHDLVGASNRTVGDQEDLEHTAFFDMAVGDYLTFSVSPGGACNWDANRTTIIVTPIGGTKGDVGPDITATQSSYFHAPTTAASGVLPGGMNDVTWTAPGTGQAIANGFTLPTNTRITATNAGRYHVTAAVGLYAGVNATSWTLGRLQLYSSAGVLKATKTFTGGTMGGSANNELTLNAIFDMAADDYITAGVQPGNASTQIDANTWISVIPVGGVKGDGGAQVTSGVQTNPWKLDANPIVNTGTGGQNASYWWRIGPRVFVDTGLWIQSGYALPSGSTLRLALPFPRSATYPAAQIERAATFQCQITTPSSAPWFGLIDISAPGNDCPVYVGGGGTAWTPINNSHFNGGGYVFGQFSYATDAP